MPHASRVSEIPAQPHARQRSRRYSGSWAKADIVAGLTAAAVVIPKALAYATVAGLPIQVGLYTAFLPMIIYAFLGTSRPLSVSTTTTLAILTATALGRVVPDGNLATLTVAVATLTALVGMTLLLASLLRLGFVANFISDPVLTGFKAGIGVVIVVDQLPKLFGLHVDKGSFLHDVYALMAGMPHLSLATFMIGAATIAMLVSIEHVWPKAPAPLVAVAACIASVALFDLSSQGVALVGPIPAGLPSLTLPDRSLVGELWPAAVGIALMSFTETIAAGRAFVRDDEPVPIANRELLATGLANLGGAFLGAMPAGGGTSQTAVNRLAGARTQMAELVTAGGALCTMLVLGPFIAMMPQATLAAVVIVYSMGLIKPAEFRAIRTIRKTEFVWAMVAAVGVVFLGTLRGIVVAIMVSLLALAYQVSDPALHVLKRKRGTTLFRPASPDYPDDESMDGLLVLRPEGRIFFVNAQRLGSKMLEQVEQASPRVVIVDLGAVFDLEYTALKMLVAAEAKARASGWEVWLVGMTPGVKQLVRRSPLYEVLAGGRMFARVEDAVSHYEGMRMQNALGAEG
ncbi:SulP family inorganic anion transporter [Dyella terrae]|uniref:SulP family inorganic anion transporter n=3 Tax=Dyella TaxID=231454 RepID=A0A4R0Z3N9_9GAMM|nr:SulP family inorganic anion transporter [Dyella terrae]TBR39063.1 SulP family inorganic anion transporter [Dyella terrae]TCI13876.1 SulP family inorganic anion transporter [Dyella soli]